jgi:hypothetical protein
VISCQSMTYLYSSSSLIARKSKGIVVSATTFCGRVSLDKTSSITYLMNTNQVYGTSLNSTGSITTSLLMTLPIDSTDLSAPTVLDLVVTTNLTIVRYDNLTIAAYFRPSALGEVATLAPRGLLTLNVAALSPLIFYDNEPSTNNLNVFVIANSYSNNQLTQYRVS